MKKYLMTGIAALALCVGFTSCSHDIEGYSPEKAQEQNAKKIVENYEKVFIATFGQPAANQEWGFGKRVSASRTRGNYANANHWGAPADGVNAQTGWIVPDTLSDGQRLRVTRYFQTHPYLTYVDPQWEDFFVQQVYTGGTDVLTSQKYSPEISSYGYSPEIYKSGAKLETEAADITSEKLNYLFAYGETEHINNFNKATASYKDVLETGEKLDEGKTHKDRINLMVQSSTLDFSYQNAYSSVRHGQPYVALVGAQTIDDWADSLKTATGIEIGEPVYYGKSYSGKDNSYWNRSFLGCDLELLIGEDIYAGTNMKLTDASSLGAQGRFVNGEYVAGIPSDDYIYNDAPVRYLKNEQNQYGGDLVKLNDSDLCYDYRKQWTDEGGNHDEYLGKVLDTNKIDELLGLGYLPVAGTGLKTWVKPQPVADHFYSDWIVTLTKAMRQGEPETIEIPIEPGSEGSDYKKDFYYKQTSFDEEASGRVFCEDLGVVRASDIDFNDIVFDVYIYKTLFYTEHMVSSDGETWELDPELGANAVEYTDSTFNGDVWLLAGGGTIPASIQVAGNSYSIKNVYGDPDITDKWIINTIENDEGRYGNRYKIIQRGVKLNDEPLAITSVADVDVYVTYDGHVGKLVAYKGAAPHKICVPIGTKWLKEREEINLGYPSFDKYVKSQDINGKYIDHEGVIPYNGQEGGYIGDGNEYNNNYNRAFDYVWEEENAETVYLYSLPVPYTPRHLSQDWDGSIISLGSGNASGGGSSSGFQNGDPVLIRVRH